MGRQIRFLMIENDESEFIDFIYESGDQLIDRQGNEYFKDEIIRNPKLSQIYIKNQQVDVIKYFTGSIDTFFSYVIEFSRSGIKDKRIDCGRLYIETTGLTHDQRIIRTEKWLEDRYQYYKKWILKHTKISTDKSAYAGKMTYSLYKAGGYKLVADLGKPEYDYVFEFE